MATTFNPADINANIALSGGNLIATGLNASNGGARGTGPGHSAGKLLLRYTSVNLVDGLDYLGIGTLADTLGLASGQQVQAIIIQQGTQFSGDGAGGVLSYGGFTSVPLGDTVDLAVDITGLLMWFRLNGGNWNNNGSANPGTGTLGNPMKAGGTFLPYVRLTNTSAFLTLNPTYAGDATTTGFAPWDSAILLPTSSQAASIC